MTDRDEILTLIARYAHLLDDRRFEEWSQLLAPDATLTVGERQFVGRDAITASVAGMQSGGWGLHFMGPSVVVVDGDSATAWTDMAVIMPGDDGLRVTSISKYTDSFVHTDGQWLFHHRRLRTPGAPPDLTNQETP